MAQIYDGKNPIYGATKSATSHFIGGLQLQHHSYLTFLNVITGPMHETSHNLSPVQRVTSINYTLASAKIVHHLLGGKKEIFLPGIWRYIIFIASLFGLKRMSTWINSFR